MAQRGTGTYLLVREGSAPRPTARPAEAASLLPDRLPDPPQGLRIRRRAVALQPHTMDRDLVVWLDPAHEATDRLYRAATPLRDTLGPIVLLVKADAAVPLEVTALNLAGACCAYHHTALVDLGEGSARVTALLGVTEDGGLEAALATRRLDATAPINVMGPARGLDLLGAAEPLWAAPGGQDFFLLRRILVDLAVRNELVLVIAAAAELKSLGAWHGVADGVLLVGPPDAVDDDVLQALSRQGLPVGWLATDCPDSAENAG